MDCQIATVMTSPRIIDDGDILLYRALPTDSRTAVGPFVFVDHYRVKSLRGIGNKPHPHAGIEVISYLLEGGMVHRDSMGFRDELGAGDAQWIRAGRGILHAEQATSGRHGLQLWTSLPPAEKFAEPAYKSWRAADIPRVDLKGGRVNVIAGMVTNAHGPMRLATATTFAHVRLEAGATVNLSVDATAELCLYVLDGQLAAADGSLLAPGSLALLTPGDRIKLKATDRPTDLAILGGAPAEGPILFAGSFVMDTVENVERAKRDYASGKMGRLDGVPY